MVVDRGRVECFLSSFVFINIYQRGTETNRILPAGNSVSLGSYRDVYSAGMILRKTGYWTQII